MNATAQHTVGSRLLLILAILFPLAIVFLLPGGALIKGAPWFPLSLVVAFFALRMMLVAQQKSAKVAAESECRMLPPEVQPEVVREVMHVGVAAEHAGMQTFHGRLRVPAETAYNRLRHASLERAFPHIQEDERLGAVIELPTQAEEPAVERPSWPWLNILLFVATLLTTTWAGAAHQGVDLLQNPERFTVGLPYSLGLLAILGLHELGHYFAARSHGIHVSLPFFIPVPFALGTFGAFIQMKSLAENRRALFDVAVAGPLAGLAVAVPLMLYGLQSSTVVPGEVVGGRLTSPDEAAAAEETAPPVVRGGTSARSSLKLAMLSMMAMPEALRYGYVIQFSPLAFAGWLGLFITGLNLMPIGQLDGGHMVRAMFGHRVGSIVSIVAVWSLVFLGLFVWRGLLMWAVIAMLLAGRPTPPLDDVTPLNASRRWLGYAILAILVMIVMPLPPALSPAADAYCPYAR